MKYAIITVTKNGADLACKLQNTLKTCDIYVKKDRYDISLTGHIYEYEKMSEVIKNIFAEYEAIAIPVITTATDTNKIIAPDVVARKYNLVPYPLEHIKIINSALIQHQKVIYYVDKDLKQSEQMIIDLARNFKIEAKLIDLEELDRQIIFNAKTIDNWRWLS